MTKTQTIAALAERTGLQKAQVSQFIDELVGLACSEAKVDPKGFTIPGVGKLVLVDRKARMGRNPATGEPISIPAKKVVKFRIAKACKDTILG